MITSNLSGNLGLNFGKAKVVLPEGAELKECRKSFERGYKKELKDAKADLPDNTAIKDEGKRRYEEYIAKVNKIAIDLPDSVTMKVTPGTYRAHTEYDGFPEKESKSDTKD